MEFIVAKRLLVEFGDMKYYVVNAQTENDSRINDRDGTPSGVAIIEFNCSVAEGSTMPIGTRLKLAPVEGK